MDFFIRNTESLIPIEVKVKDKPTPSLNKLIESKNVNYGIKLCYKNFGFNGKFYTIPYFAVFCLKRWIKEKAKINPHHHKDDTDSHAKHVIELFSQKKTHLRKRMFLCV